MHAAPAKAAKGGAYASDSDGDKAEGKLDDGRRRAGGGGGPGGGSDDFRAAKSLYDAGRYAEALPKLDALASSDPAAALYAARCAAKTKGCAAAAPRYDRIAQERAGTAPGSRAALEIARCFKDAGQTANARSRYDALTTDNYVASEANADLAALDAPRAARPVARPAAPAATATVAPAR
jgi:thioredoxin-like negative regulator of GroEL